MKRILAPILLLTLLFPALAFGVTVDDLVERGGLYYKKFSEVPFTGKVTGREQGAFENGKSATLDRVRPSPICRSSSWFWQRSSCGKKWVSAGLRLYWSVLAECLSFFVRAKWKSVGRKS